MPNIKSFTPQANPEWITVELDDGTITPAFHDPTGEIRAQVTDISSKVMGAPPPSAMAGAVAGPGGGEQPFVAPPQPAANPIFTPPGGAPVAAPPVAPGPAPAVPMAPAPVRPVAPPVAVPAPATGTFPAPSAAPRGMARSGVARSVQGMAEEDKAQVDALNTEAVEATGEANAATVKARLDQLTNDWARISDQEKAELAKQQLREDRERQLTERFDAQMATNKETAARPIDPAAAFDGDAGWYAFMAAFGDAVSNFGAAISGRAAVADPAGRINAIIDRSVRLQTAQKQAEYEDGKITADQLEAERERVRLNITTAGEQLVRLQDQKAQTENERLGLDALGKTLRAQQADAMAKNAMATARQETRQEQFAPVVTGPAKVTNATKEALALLGVTPEQYTEGMNKKIGQGENAPTVNQAVTAVNEMDQDLMMFKAIRAANGGTIPTKGAINMPEALRGKLAQMGVTSAMSAEEVSQIFTGYVLRKARLYGGAVTAPDYENAQKEFGQSGDGFIRGIERMRDGTNNTIRQSIDTIFPGVGQDVLGISLRRTAQTPGVAAPEAIEDFEVQSAEHTDGSAPAPPSDVEKRQEQNRARAVERVGSVLKPIGESAARPPTGAYRSKM